MSISRILVRIVFISKVYILTNEWDVYRLFTDVRNKIRNPYTVTGLVPWVSRIPGNLPRLLFVYVLIFFQFIKPIEKNC